MTDIVFCFDLIIWKNNRMGRKCKELCSKKQNNIWRPCGRHVVERPKTETRIGKNSWEGGQGNEWGSRGQRQCSEQGFWGRAWQCPVCPRNRNARSQRAKLVLGIISWNFREAWCNKIWRQGPWEWHLLELGSLPQRKRSERCPWRRPSATTKQKAPSFGFPGSREWSGGDLLFGSKMLCRQLCFPCERETVNKRKPRGLSFRTENRCTSGCHAAE